MAVNRGYNERIVGLFGSNMLELDEEIPLHEKFEAI